MPLMFYVLNAFELAGREIYRKKTKALRRGLTAMKALKARCMAALEHASRPEIRSCGPAVMRTRTNEAGTPSGGVTRSLPREKYTLSRRDPASRSSINR